MNAREELRALAAEATPGPWESVAGAFGDPSDGPDHMRVVTEGWSEAFDAEHTIARLEHDRQGGADAAFIAAVSPDRITALLDELDAAERRIDSLCAELREAEWELDEAYAAVVKRADAWDEGHAAGYEARRSEGQFIRFVDTNPYRTEETR